MPPTETSSIIVDLSQSKLHIYVKHKLEVSLHFDSPSRRFYLAVIAFVIMEMKNNERFTSIQLGKHYKTLALFNETVGGHAGSSEREKLLSRIYRKWKDALPDLEFAPLFKVIGKKKEYGDTVGRAYNFTDLEKDYWANLFEYKGSGKNVRLKLSIDKLGLNLSDVRIAWGEKSEISNRQAWDKFIETLRENRDKDTKNKSHGLKKPKPVIEMKNKLKRKTQIMLSFAVVIILFLGMAIAFWNFYLRTSSTIEPAPHDKMAFPLPDIPSIAVLPFHNLSKDPEFEYIADSITDNIIMTLSQVPKMLVIARHSVLQYKNKPVKISQVSTELGVRHVIEGSVQLSGPRLRINVQLIDAVTEKHLWADGYDGELKDLFAMQDDITMKIITELQVNLTKGDFVRLASKGTDNIDAYLKWFKGYQFFINLSQENNSQAQKLAREVIILDPNYSQGYTLLGYTYVRDAVTAKDISHIKSKLKQAEDLARQSLELDDFMAEPHMLMSYIFQIQHKWDQALLKAEEAVSITPFPTYLYRYADVLNNVGRPVDAAEMCKIAMIADPIPPAYAIGILGRAYFLAEQYEKALDEAMRWFTHIEKIDPAYNISHPHVLLAVTYVMLGQIDKARKHIAEAKKIDPHISSRLYERMWNTNYEGIARWVSALRQAGLE